jgi:hypothetical protein
VRHPEAGPFAPSTRATRDRTGEARRASGTFARAAAPGRWVAGSSLACVPARTAWAGVAWTVQATPSTYRGRVASVGSAYEPAGAWSSSVAMGRKTRRPTSGLDANVDGRECHMRELYHRER